MRLDNKRKPLSGALIAAAVGLPLLLAALMGWAMALNTMGTFTELNDRLADTKAELALTKADLSRTSEELSEARAALTEIPEAERTRAELRKQVGSLHAEMAHLKAGIGTGSATLDRLRNEVRHLKNLQSGTGPEYLTTGWARLRTGPSTQASEIAVVNAGVPLRVLEAVGDGRWYKVARIGFMHRTLLAPEASTAAQ